MSDKAISISNLQFNWQTKANFELRVDRLVVPKGSKTMIVGASGSGKSTLLALLCGIVSPQAGSIVVCGQDLQRLSAARRDSFRAEHIGLVFQQFNLLPYASVLDNILLPLEFAPQRRKRVTDAPSQAARLCADLGLDPSVLTTTASKLSVGQQQRVAVARAMIGAPELIVCDEPTSALDSAAQELFLTALFQQLDKLPATLLMVSHQEQLGARFDTLISMDSLASAHREVS